MNKAGRCITLCIIRYACYAYFYSTFKINIASSRYCSVSKDFLGVNGVPPSNIHIFGMSLFTCPHFNARYIFNDTNYNTSVATYSSHFFLQIVLY